MEAGDIEVLRQAAAWLRGGDSVYLATVARTWGSSPRPAGSLAAFHGDGTVVGSVSGGCIEDELRRYLRDGDRMTQPARVRYGVTADEARRFGLPCGGTLEVIVEALGDANELDAILAAVESGRLISRYLDLRTGASHLRDACDAPEFSDDGRMLVRRFGPAWRLLIIGAAQPSRYLAEMAQPLGYHVTVCDPRAEYTSVWDVPGVTIDQRMPDDVVSAMAPDPRTAVVTLTHDPKLDDLALWEALTSKAFYVGALGSARTNDARRERLRSLGVPADAVARLRGPVGLPIGSRTPPEIAVAILAELIAVRRGRATGDGLDLAGAGQAASQAQV